MSKFYFNKKNTQIDLQSPAIYVDKTNLQKSLHILGDGASGCASDDIEQVTIITLFEIW